MKSCIAFILLLFFINPLYADIKCPDCSTLNKEEDRYCINCAAEIRNLTKEEKENLEKEKFVTSLKTTSLNTYNNSSPVEPLPEKTGLKASETGKTGANKDFLSQYKGFKIKLGQGKASFKKNFEIKKGSYEPNEWNLQSKKSDEDCRMTLYFENQRVSGWELNEKIPLYIERDFPLDETDLKTGMTFLSVMTLLGYPDIKNEKNFYNSYSLQVFYYVNQPREEGFGLGVERIKDGTVIEINFDKDRKIQSVSKGTGEKLICSNKNFKIYPKSYRVPSKENDC